MKLWGGRFETGPSQLFERFSESLSFDRRLIDADCRGSQAFARALQRVGILTADECKTLVEAFEQIRGEARVLGYFDGATDEDIHTLVIRKLKEKIGSLADKIHTGRSRNEQVSLDVRLWLREEIDLIHGSLTALLDAVLDIAGKYPGAVIPGYTHTRRAQAVLWPHYMLAYFEMFSRDAERLADARRRTDVMPLGSGALALDFLYAASMVMLHLSRLAEDWILYSGEEYGWLELGDEVTSGSSLMPQKKNPDSLELVRGKCGRVYGALNALFLTMKGLPMTYNRDMQEDKEPLFEAADQVLFSIQMTEAVIRSAKLNPAKPAAAAEASWVVATDLAEELARSGTPFHQAHQIVGRLVLESVRDGKKPSDWTAEQLAAFAPEFHPAMARLLKPNEGMKSREVPGGTGPAAVAQAIAEAEQRLSRLR
jgi:argininosuccinate lyase